MNKEEFIELMRCFGFVYQPNEERVNNAPLPSSQRRYVYGLSGIASLFGVSHVTAQHYKDGILKDACIQNGRKILVDAERAMELFNQQRG